MLRCVVFFAHWVTLELGRIAAGGDASITFRREPDGALYVARDDGRPMHVENIYCGSDAAWGASRGQVPLLAIQSGTGRSFRTFCGIAGRVFCMEPRAGD